MCIRDRYKGCQKENQTGRGYAGHSSAEECSVSSSCRSGGDGWRRSRAKKVHPTVLITYLSFKSSHPSPFLRIALSIGFHGETWLNRRETGWRMWGIETRIIDSWRYTQIISHSTIGQPHQSTRLYPLQKQVKWKVTDCLFVTEYSALIIKALALYSFLLLIKWHFIRNKVSLYHR